MKDILNAFRKCQSYSSEINILSLQSLYQGRFDYLQEKSYSLLLKKMVRWESEGK